MTTPVLLEPSVWPGTLEDPPPIRVEPGETVVMTGPPGCGTSLALLALAGRTREELPGALLEGCSPATLSHRKRRELMRKLRLAYLPHEPILQSNLSVMENLLLPFRFLGEQDETKVVREALILLNVAGLGWAAALLPSRISPEARKTVAIARALLRKPRVALLDSPLSDLDEGSLAACRSLIRALARSGECAILAATREPGHFQGIPHRKVALRPAAGQRPREEDPIR